MTVSDEGADLSLDRPVYGARAIAEILNLRDDKGKPDRRKAYYMLEAGYADAVKIGGRWTSTPRRLLRVSVVAPDWQPRKPGPKEPLQRRLTP